jgi:hypothetical protein
VAVAELVAVFFDMLVSVESEWPWVGPRWLGSRRGGPGGLATRAGTALEELICLDGSPLPFGGRKGTKGAVSCFCAGAFAVLGL